MELKVDDELYTICKNIMKEERTTSEWSLLESSDMFQTQHYCGGYDATENAFCFSYFDDARREFWFQLTLDEIRNIVKLNKININLSEKN